MQSMTGFGRAEGTIGGSHLSIEIKSVNHRYLDTRFRMPSFLSSLELPFSQKLRESFHRGSFDCSIRHKLLGTQASALAGTRFVVDEFAAKSVQEATQWLHENGFTDEKKVSLSTFAQLGRVLVPVEDTDAIDEKQPEILKIFESAIQNLKQTRGAEGARISEVLLTETSNLETLQKSLTEMAPKQPEHIRNELEKRIASWNLSHSVDEQKLETELAFFADRADFTEELDRLASHLKEFRELIGAEGPIGRKLDFYTQELHRELNTMGSKTQLTEITRLVVQGKSSVEKLRQQVQNVE